MTIECTPLDIARRFIEHAPADPGPVNPDLSGWTGKGLDICASCAGRIVMRGCDLTAIVSQPVWKPDVLKCQVCCGQSLVVS